MTLVYLKALWEANSCAARNEQYVGLREIEAALTEIYFYPIKKHLLPESMFNIKQQKFILSFLVFSPSVLAYHWSIL